MRKILLFSLIMIVLGVLLVGCGESKKPVVPTQTSAFAFLRATSTANLFTPVLGKFVTTGTNTQYSETTIKDTSTGQDVKGQLWSIILSAKGDKATFDLYGGMTADTSNNQWDIYVANADGTGIVQVTNDAYDDAMPQFSPDGSKVVFTSNRFESSESVIVIRNIDGTHEQVLPLPAGVHGTWAPTFSPDGSKIAVEAWGTNDSGNFYGIWIMNADGSSPQMLTGTAYNTADIEDTTPSFTKDGSQIVFSREDYTGSVTVADIYIMKADGSGGTKLTDSKGINSDPLILGDRVLFSSNRDSATGASADFEIYTMNLDGSGITRLTNNSLYDGFCAEWYESSGASAAYQHRVGALRHRR